MMCTVTPTVFSLRQSWGHWSTVTDEWSLGGSANIEVGQMSGWLQGFHYLPLFFSFFSWYLFSPCITRLACHTDVGAQDGSVVLS